MVFGAFNGVGHHGAGFHDKGPVTGLGEKEFAGGLAQSSIKQGVRVLMAEAPCEFDHTDGGDMQVGIDPSVGGFEPNGGVALIPPRGGARLTDLVGMVAGEEFGWRDHGKCFLVAGGFTKEVIEKDRAFVPPVAVEFRIVRTEDEGFDAHDSAKMLDLFFPIEHKIGGVAGGAFAGEMGPVGFFVRGATSDSIIFESSKLAKAVGLDVGADVVVLEIEAAIAVEIAVLGVAGVTFFGAPDLFTGFDIATESGGTCGGEDGGEDAVGGAGFGMEETVGIENEPTDFGFLEVVF